MDVLDDEDVQLMLEEWREAAEDGAPGLRLHIFVQVGPAVAACRCGRLLSAVFSHCILAGYHAGTTWAAVSGHSLCRETPLQLSILPSFTSENIEECVGYRS